MPLLHVATLGEPEIRVLTVFTSNVAGSAGVTAYALPVPVTVGSSGAIA